MILKPVFKQAWNKITKKAGFIKFVVLVWSAGLLTASYAGWMPKMDPTYVVPILSGTLATFSITREKKQ